MRVVETLFSRKRQSTTSTGALVLLALLVLIFSLRSPHFLTLKTFTAIANQIPGLTVLAVGMTFVILIGGIDLSVGSVMAFCAVGLATALVEWQWSLFAAVAFAFALGLLCGSINGAVTTRWNIPPFIVTLAMLEMARGAAYLMAQSRTIYIGSAVSWVNSPVMGETPSFSFLLALTVILGAHLLLEETVFGRYVVGIGTNENAMRLSGINCAAVRISVFGGAGLLAALAAILESSRLEAADPNAGIGLELRVIAAVVIGGTSLMGGRGSVLSTLLGVLIVSVLETGLAQLGTSEPFKRIMTGAVIVIAVIMDIRRNQVELNRRYSPGG
jgi:ribose transport system permease protein